MDENNHGNHVHARNDSNTLGEILVRFIASVVVLAITAFFTPGFHISNIWALALGAVALTVIDYLITRITGIQASPFGKGFVGFITAGVVLYLTQFFVAGYTISWVGAIIGALIYGIVDYFIPGDSTM